MQSKQNVINRVYLLILLGSIFIFLSLFIGVFFSQRTFADENTTSVDNIVIAVPTSCTFFNNITDHNYSVSMLINTYNNNVGTSDFTIFCNDTNGYALYAIGYSNDTYGTTDMIGSDPNSPNIVTGTATSGTTSNWAMKMSATAGTYRPTITGEAQGDTDDFTDFHNIPSTFTKVATFPAVTDRTTGSRLQATYADYISPNQRADTYTGKVRYTLFHPDNSCLYYQIQFNAGTGTGTMDNQKICQNVATVLNSNTLTPPAGYEFKEWNTSANGTGTSYADGASVTNLVSPGETLSLYAIWWQPPYLYNAIANMTKGTLAENNVGVDSNPTRPTSTDISEDTSNSGVYTYDPAVYGVASDASNDYPIYFYRGILDTAASGNSGSRGSANAYPNYVKLGNNTCWRIIRTTGSGGIKMIYSGTYGASTSGSCANDQSYLGTNRTDRAFNSSSSLNKHYIGYTYNSNMNGVATSTPIGTVFGDNSDPSVNDTRSTIKIYLEDTWYANNMTAYTNMLEASAGYCNDRTITSSSITSVVPYNGNPDSMYFGAASRSTPSLNCPRDIVDLYRYVPNSDGLGNELKYPVALLTSDEAKLIGYSRYSFISPYSGYSGNTMNHSGLFTMSPYYVWGKSSYMYALTADGDSWGLRNIKSDNTSYTRPVISLVHSTTIASGSGTATDPWLIDE